MSKKYKPITWQEDTIYIDGAEVPTATADVPFCITLSIANRGNKGTWHWAVHTEMGTISSGKCSTLDKAKKNAEQAFQSYVEEQIAKCREE